MARLEVLLPFSSKLSPCPRSALPRDLKGSSTSLRWACRSWADRDVEGGAWEFGEALIWVSEETVGRGFWLEEQELFTEDGGEPEDESVPKYNTWNYTQEEERH